MHPKAISVIGQRATSPLILAQMNHGQNELAGEIYEPDQGKLASIITTVLQ